MIPWNARHARGSHDVLALALAAHGLDSLPWRADEGEACFRAFAREGRVLAQEAVARVDAVAALVFGDLDDAVAVEVGGRLAEVDGERRAEGVLGVGVGVSVDGGGADTVLGGCAIDAAGVWSVRGRQLGMDHKASQGDFPSICYQDGGQRLYYRRVCAGSSGASPDGGSTIGSKDEAETLRSSQA